MIPATRENHIITSFLRRHLFMKTRAVQGTIKMLFINTIITQE